MSIAYRPFCNWDPPGIVRIWNECYTGRGAAYMNGTLPLEFLVLAKPYFDPQGLIVAEEDGELIGFVHAGFAGDSSGSTLSYERGIICALAVRPPHQRKGVGRELLHRGEAYLRSRGAMVIQAGQRRPVCPFYWGLLSGSEPAGILASDNNAQAFLLANGYWPGERCLIYQRELMNLPLVADVRFADIKRRCDLIAQPRPVSPNWFEEVVYSPLEMLEFHLVESSQGESVAQVRVWDMEHFAWRWHQPSAGLIDLIVPERHRRLGYAKFLIAQVMRYLQEQFYGLVEFQVPESNVPAQRLAETLGFVKVDEGRVFHKE